MPLSGTWILGKTGEPDGVRYNRLITAVQNLLQSGPGTCPIDLIAKERNLSLAMAGRLPRRLESITLTTGLHAMVDMLGARFGVPVINADPSTVRKHFINTGAHIENVKDVVLQRAKLLGYVDGDCTDTDRGDALAVWDWALALYGGRTAVYHFHGG